MKMKRVQTVRILLERAIRAGLAPGMVAGWQEATDPQPETVAVGRARVSPFSTTVSPNTWFDLASLTKPLVVGTLSLLAMRDRWFEPDTTAADVLPEIGAFPTGGLSVRQLLTHSSGLPAWEPIYALTGGNSDRLLDTLGGLKIDEPGSQVVYSCPGFILLGAMLERLADTGLDDLFVERVLKPLGLEAELSFRPATVDQLAAGAHAPGAERLILHERGLDPSLIPANQLGHPDDGNSRFLGGVAGNAGLFGTIAGVLTLARIYFGVGEFLTSDEIELATADHTQGLEQARGFGWQLASSPGCSAGATIDPSAFGHTGFTGTSLWMDPTRGLAMALLTNRVHPDHRPTDLHPLRRRFHHLVVDNQD